jgi:hypothetical protein
VDHVLQEAGERCHSRASRRRVFDGALRTCQAQVVLQFQLSPSYPFCSLSLKSTVVAGTFTPARIAAVVEANKGFSRITRICQAIREQL